MDRFLEKFNLPRLNQEKIEIMNNPITSTEIGTVNKILPRNKGGQESQASSWVEAWNSACLSRCPRGERPLVELYLEPGVFSERCTEKLPLRVDCIHRLEFGEVSGHWVLIKRGPGNRGPTECGTTHEATSGMSS